MGGRLMVLALVAGCGGGKAPADHGPATTDAPTSDSASTPTPTSPTGTTDRAPVTVRVATILDDEALVGVDVLVSDADGQVVGLFPTGSLGTVDVDVPDGGSVSYAEAWNGYDELSSAFDVQPGDAVQFSSYRFLTTGSTTEQTGTEYDFSVQGVAYGAAASYDYYTRCDSLSGGTLGPYPFDNTRCLGFDTEQAVVIGFDGQHRIQAWGEIPNFQVSDGGRYGVALVETAVDAMDTEVVNLPSTLSQDGMVLSATRQGWQNPQSRVDFTDPSGGTAVLELPALGYDRYFYQAWGEQPNGQSWVQIQVANHRLPNHYTFDMAGLARVSVDPIRVVDPDHPEVDWVLTAGPTGDVGFAQIGWAHGTEKGGTWSASFDPAARHSVAVPDLPDEWATFTPAGGTDFGGNVQLVEVDFADGYTDWLAQSPVWPDEYTTINATTYSPQDQ